MIWEHGGNIGGIKGVTDFSANINPLGMPESVRQAVIASAGEWESYPDPYCKELSALIAEREGVPRESVVCGNGAADLIYRLVHAVRPKRAGIIVPTFSEYEKALAEVGCVINKVMLPEEKGFALDKDMLTKVCEDADMVFLCSPNNPTGRMVSGDMLASAAEKCAKSGALLVCDESFIGFAENGSESSLLRHMNKSCAVLRAFTKLYAMAGLRLGYMIFGDTKLADSVRKSGQFWSVSVPAQAAGIAAMKLDGFEEKTSAYIKTERGHLGEGLSRLGLRVYPSDADFLLFRGREGLVESLIPEGILLRECGNFDGLDGSFYRTAVRTREENERFLRALERVM